MKVGIDTFDCGHGKNNAGMYLNSILKNLPQSKIDGPLDIELFGLESDRDDFEDFIGTHLFLWETKAVSFLGVTI